MLFRLIGRLLIIVWILNVADNILLVYSNIVYYIFVSISRRNLLTHQQYIKLWFFLTHNI